MKNIWESLSGYKTYLIVLITVFYAVIGVALSLHTLDQAIQVVLAALAVAGLRNGLSATIEDIIVSIIKRKK